MQRVAQLQEREIYKVLYPTVGIFLPLLEAKREAITRTCKRTFSYGPSSRHKLDVYYPAASSETRKTKILVFCYGGGLNSGSRTLPAPAELSYGNLGMYFSQQGIVTVVPDYRLSPEVKHPEAARDVRDAVEWVLDNPHCLRLGVVQPEVDSIYVMGHSAGACNVFTMLTHPELKSDVLQSKIAGIVLLSGAYTYDSTNLPIILPAVVKDYYGGEEVIPAKLPLALLNSFDVSSLPRILLGVSERDPPSFLTVSKIFEDALSSLKVPHDTFIAKGHNHISVNYCLGTGEGEEWAAEVVSWIYDEWKALK